MVATIKTQNFEGDCDAPKTILPAQDNFFGRETLMELLKIAQELVKAIGEEERKSSYYFLKLGS